MFRLTLLISYDPALWEDVPIFSGKASHGVMQMEIDITCHS